MPSPTRFRTENPSLGNLYDSPAKLAQPGLAFNFAHADDRSLNNTKSNLLDRSYLPQSNMELTQLVLPPNPASPKKKGQTSRRDSKKSGMGKTKDSFNSMHSHRPEGDLSKKIFYEDIQNT